MFIEPPDEEEEEEDDEEETIPSLVPASNSPPTKPRAQTAGRFTTNQASLSYSLGHLGHSTEHQLAKILASSGVIGVGWDLDMC
jgi:hypothetical protein